MKMIGFTRLRCPAAAAMVMLVVVLCVPNVRASDDTLIELGDYLQLLIPAAGLAGTHVADDPEGRIQFWQTWGSSIAITSVGKFAFGKLRPNLSDTNATSFPSGHTTSAFAGAGFIYERYGPLYGIPAYSLAALTGYSRIVADAHHWDDVLAGASVGMMNSWYWASPFKTKVMLMPMAVDDGFGVSFIILDTAFQKGKEEEIKLGKRPPKFSYTIAFMPTWQKENIITAPSSTGTPFDLASFKEVGEPISTSVGNFDWYIGKRHTLTVGLAPYEQRDEGAFGQPTNFNGVIFPANTPIVSRWRHFEGWVNYAYEFFPESDCIFKLGAGLTYQYTDLEIVTQDGSLYSEVKDSVFLPLAHLNLGYRITDRWTIETAVNGIYLDEDRYIDASLETGYMLSKRWRAALGVAIYDRNIETSELTENFRYTGVYLSLGYYFY